MRTRIVLLLVFAAGMGFAGDWSPKLAADYMDSRQKAWVVWPRAQRDGAPCISCHTNVTYLLARPALSKALGEKDPPYEGQLLDSLRRSLERKIDPKSQAIGTEAVFAALFLESDAALDRLWKLQTSEGKNAGAWSWFNTDLEPWEEPESVFYGASLAALAVGRAPGGYASRPSVQPNIDALKTYLRSQQAGQPLQNRLVLAWASTKLPGLLTQAERAEIIRAVESKQQEDGAWTTASLGPWKPRPNAPGSGSNAYPTALAAYLLQESGVPRSNKVVERALSWLRAHQDPKTGSWADVSMNKSYEPDSIPVDFMRDAATGFASLALLAGQ